MAKQAQCPVCGAELGDKIPNFCPTCGWECGTDISLNLMLTPPTPSELVYYRSKLARAIARWESHRRGQIDMVLPGPADMEAQHRGNIAFAFEMFSVLYNPCQNLIFSPYSISAAFGMVAAGAAGRTLSEIDEVMGFRLPQPLLHGFFQAMRGCLDHRGDDEAGVLKIANSLFPNKELESYVVTDYLQVLKLYYDVDLNYLNYFFPMKAAEEINAWVESNTERRIKNLIDPEDLSALTAAVLVNAIYFQAAWLVPFSEDQTQKLPFITSSDLNVEIRDVPQHHSPGNRECDMMYQKNDFWYADVGAYQLLDMPYKNNDISMLVILPKEIEGIEHLCHDLKRNYVSWLGCLERTKVEVYLPKMEFDHFVELTKMLKSMGMIAAFEDSADFSKMFSGGNVCISKVLHKAFIKLEEQGTEAAAATAVMFRDITCPQPSWDPIPVFRADHPFVFVIRHTSTQAILFIGKLSDPELSVSVTGQHHLDP